MKALTAIAQPKPEVGWVHRFRNFGEEVYVQLRASCAVDLAEIDAAFDEFHVGGIREKEADAVARSVAAMTHAHRLEDSVFLHLSDAPVYHRTVVLVLDSGLGEGLWEIAGRHPVWVVDSKVNRAAVEELRTKNGRRAAEVTIWANGFDPATEQDWSRILRTIDRHDGAGPVNKLSVYGAAATPPAVAALRAHGFEDVRPTASGLLALR